MPFPTKERVYETDIEQWDSTVTDTSNDTAAYTALLQFKNMWQGQSHFGFAGTINSIVPGTTYELVATNRAGNYVLNPTGDFTRNGPLVGRYIEIQNATTPANNGIFLITAVINSSTIRYTNAGGVAEAFSGEYRVNRPSAPGVRGTPKRFPSWVCKGSSAGSTGKGAGMDGRDRWHTQTDMQFTSGATGNHSWIVLRNTANGVEILIDLAFASVSRRIEAWVSPELGFTGGTTTTRPTAGDAFRFSGDGALNNGYWFLMENWYPKRLQLVFMQSDDGDQDFMVLYVNDVDQGMLATGLAGAPENAGPLVPWNGNNAYVIFPDGRARNLENTPRITYDEYLDNPRTVITVDKDGAGPGPVSVLCHLTANMIVSSSLGREYPTIPDLGQQFPGDRIGLASAQSGYRGRHAYIPDMLFANAGVNNGVAQFSSIPGDGSRQWVKIGHFYLPWDGSDTLRRF